MIESDASRRPTSPALADGTTADGLWRAHALDLKRLAFLLLGDEGAAEDAVADAFARSWHRLDDVDVPIAYVRRAVINACRDEVRRRERSRRRDERAAVGEQVELDLAQLELLDVLARLPLRQRAAVVLRHVVGLDDVEIAKALGCRPATVRSSVRHGLAKLRKELS
jgi:RNA polymerase sigma factor (sigma-70 family)